MTVISATFRRPGFCIFQGIWVSPKFVQGCFVTFLDTFFRFTSSSLYCIGLDFLFHFVPKLYNIQISFRRSIHRKAICKTRES